MIALDLFAGHGWGVACDRIGIQEYGVEIMPEAVATRDANGMTTLYRDVWEGLDGTTVALDDYDVLIASPPCQTFSMAGKGAGRAALDEVLEAIRSGAYHSATELRAFGERHDPRTALVLAPLAYIARDLPRVVVLEQVPTVLPVWQAYAEVLRSWGYSVETGVLSAEQYGVPQTRKRAILVARWDGEAKLPAPTHNAYNPRGVSKGRYADTGLLPWVSMAEALEWGMTERPYVTVAAGTSSGGTDPAHLGGSGARQVVANERDSGRWLLQSQYSTTPREGLEPPKGSKLPRVTRELDEPAPTMTSKFPAWYRGNQKPSGVEYQHRATDEPAPTITSGTRWAHWAYERPATTIAGDSRVWAPGHKVNAADIARLGEAEARERYGDRAGTDAIRITADEAAALQSYPPGFVFCGGKGAIAQQIGNAVPPLLAEAVLRAAIQ